MIIFAGKTPVMISEDAKYDDGVVQEQVGVLYIDGDILDFTLTLGC